MRLWTREENILLVKFILKKTHFYFRPHASFHHYYPLVYTLMNLPRFFSNEKILKSLISTTVQLITVILLHHIFNKRDRKEKLRQSPIPHPKLLHRRRRIKILMNLPRKKSIEKILAPLIFFLLQLTPSYHCKTILELPLPLENYKKF